MRAPVFVRPSPLVVWAIALLGFAPFLPWIVNTARLSTGMDVPMAFLWQRTAPVDGFALGLAVLILGLVLGVLALIPQTATVVRIAGVVLVAVAVAFVVQWGLYLGSLDAAGQLVAYIGVGVYAVLAAGVMLAAASPSTG